MKRRNFIKSAGTVITLPLLFNGMRVSALNRPSLFEEMDPENDRVLVLIQLNGGNDGLNTIIPLDQYDTLANLRSNIIIPSNRILPVSDTIGFHPEMGGLKNLWEEGKLNMVQSVGYPNQNRSHFRSMDIWQSASPANEAWTTGWLGRYFESDHPEFPEGYPNADFPYPFAITMGNVVSETCQGIATNFSMTLSDPFSLSPLAESGEMSAPDTPYGEELSFLRTTIAQSNEYATAISEAAEKGGNQVNYPETNFANQLKNIALMISGGLGTKVYIASLGGFDTHANQVEEGNPLTGEHATLLKTLSEAVLAFQQDLQAQGLEERVIGLTFSEFGRQIRSNFSLGTDHGTAAPLFVFGSCANPQVLGTNPEIRPDTEVQEGVPMQYDFRDIYGSVLEDWFGISATNIMTLLHADYQHIPVIADCNLATSTNILIEDPVEISAFPNPFRSDIRIQFRSHGGRVRLSIFNALGSELAVLLNQSMPDGQHTISWNGEDLPKGTYYYRYQEGARQTIKMIIKQ